MNLIVNIKAYKQNTIIIISKQQNATNYTPKSQTSYLRNVHCVIMRLIERYLVLMTVPPLLIVGPDDANGLVKAGKLPVTLCSRSRDTKTRRNVKNPAG